MRLSIEEKAEDRVRGYPINRNNKFDNDFNTENRFRRWK